MNYVATHKLFLNMKRKKDEKKKRKKRKTTTKTVIELNNVKGNTCSYNS